VEKSAHKNEKNLLPPADLLGEIEKLRDDVSVERDRYLHMMADKNGTANIFNLKPSKIS
jgi:hypothetical protein